jgi:hypothetical protein
MLDLARQGSKNLPSRTTVALLVVHPPYGQSPRREPREEDGNGYEYAGHGFDCSHSIHRILPRLCSVRTSAAQEDGTTI